MRKAAKVRLLRQCDEFAENFWTRQNNHDTQSKNRVDEIGEQRASSSIKHLIRVDMQTIERNITDNVRSEVDNAEATVETRVFDAISAAMVRFADTWNWN